MNSCPSVVATSFVVISVLAILAVSFAPHGSSHSASQSPSRLSHDHLIKAHRPERIGSGDAIGGNAVLPVFESLLGSRSQRRRRLPRPACLAASSRALRNGPP